MFVLKIAGIKCWYAFLAKNVNCSVSVVNRLESNIGEVSKKFWTINVIHLTEEAIDTFECSYSQCFQPILVALTAVFRINN